MGRTTRLSAILILLAAIQPAPVGAEEIPLNVLLERHVEALGGRQAIEGIRSIASTGEIEFRRGGRDKSGDGTGKKKSATIDLEPYIQEAHAERADSV